jgi:hypothetical protein
LRFLGSKSNSGRIKPIFKCFFFKAHLFFLLDGYTTLETRGV